MALLMHQHHPPQTLPTVFRVGMVIAHLERHPRLHLLGQYLRNRFVEVLQDAHRELRLDAAVADEFVQGVC